MIFPFDKNANCIALLFSTPLYSSNFRATSKGRPGKSICWHLLMIVSGNFDLLLVTKINDVFLGGSSSILSKAFADSPPPSAKRCASKIITIFRPDACDFK